MKKEEPAIFSPEIKLLFASSLFPLSPEEVERLHGACLPSLDWELFQQLVDYHGTLPNVGLNLMHHAPGLVPREILEGFQKRLALVQQSSTALLLELARIAQLMAQADIPICPLKGPILSQALYGNPLQRISCDLDLLIPVEALIAADSVLRTNGYTRIQPKWEPSRKQQEFYPKIDYHFTYFQPKRHAYIEMHWSIAATYMAPKEITRLMLDRSSVNNFFGFPIRSLIWEDTITYLVLHGSKHNWAQLKWIVDVAVLCRREPNIEWEKVKETIYAIGWQRSLLQSQYLLKSLFSMPILPAVECWAVKEPSSLGLAQGSLNALGRAHPVGIRSGRLERGRLILYWMKLKPGLYHKLRMVGMGLINPDDWQDVSLPDQLFPLYILLRPALWLWRFHINPRRIH